MISLPHKQFDKHRKRLARLHREQQHAMNAIHELLATSVGSREIALLIIAFAHGACVTGTPRMFEPYT